MLANDFPQLRPMLAKLMEDHRLVADVLSRLQELAEEFDQASADRPADVRRMRGEVDGLSAILESHFAFEERQLGRNPQRAVHRSTGDRHRRHQPGGEQARTAPRRMIGGSMANTSEQSGSAPKVPQAQAQAPRAPMQTTKE